MSQLPDEPNKKFHSFTLLTHCGGGAYGDVWYCQDISGKKLALKIVSKQKIGEQWERELKGVQNYRVITENQPGLLPIYHVGEDDETFFYTMEPADNAGTREKYIPDTLAHRLQNGALSPAEYPAILDGIFRSIKNIHDEGFTHRDIKPDNILFVNGQPKLADIGLMSSLQNTVTQLAGTLDFLPPEQRAGVVNYDRRSRQQSDLYAFGKVIYCVITGYLPQKYPSPPEQLTYEPAEKYFFRLALRLCDHDICRRIVKIDDLAKEMAEIHRKLEYGETFRDQIKAFVHSFYLYLRASVLHTYQWGKRHYFLVSGAALFAALTGYYLSGQKSTVTKDVVEAPTVPDDSVKEEITLPEVEPQYRTYPFYNCSYSLSVPVNWQIVERPALIAELKKKPEKQQYQLLNSFRHIQAYFLLPDTGARIMAAVLPFDCELLQKCSDEEIKAHTGAKIGYDLAKMRVLRYDNFRNQRNAVVITGRMKNDDRVDLYLLPRKGNTVCLMLHQGRDPGQNDYIQFIELLESLRDAAPGSVEYKADPDGRNAFMQAALSGDFQKAETFLQNGADINSTAFGNTAALHFAVLDDLLHVVKFLLANDADVNVQNVLKMTPLHLAARDGKAVILAELLKAEPKLNLRDFQELPPLYYAVSGGHEACVKLLLKAGADVKFMTHPVFKTPLIMTAVVQNNPAVLAALLAGGIDLQAKNGIGENALLRVLNLFISGRNPAKLKLAEMLIRSGIDVNCQDERGISALMYAAVAGNESLIQLLLKHGADKTLKDGQGRTASAYLDGVKYPHLKKYYF